MQEVGYIAAQTPTITMILVYTSVCHPSILIAPFFVKPEYLPLPSPSPPGTVVALEKEGGILKPEHLVILEATRDKIEAELTQHRSSQ